MGVSRWIILAAIAGLTTVACSWFEESEMAQDYAGKPVVYQIFTRLFGNTNNAYVAWGTLEQNGVGKFNDISDAALSELKELGVTHVWYTGVLHHALVGDYSALGITADDPDVVKGRAGSPYAVKDYYSVNPDLAVDPANRLAEFDALIARTHAHGLKVIIDIVPNHVARNYQSISKPAGIEDFGARDDTSVEYTRDNNFYYVVDQAFQVPEWQGGYLPLGGEPHPLADGKFSENPAKWTGNGSRSAQPNADDWYETVKINFGVRPDGSYDFPSLPAELNGAPAEAHYQFWQDKRVPDSWLKFRDIVQFWLARGVDGYRYDMAEMVPVEFWSFLNSSIKTTKPDSFLLAEVYNPDLYRDYLQRGKMDYLYDKVDFYDSLKNVMQGRGSTDALEKILLQSQDISTQMLHFLENHDEQRIASEAFAGSAERGKPALVISALTRPAPMLIYFAQEVGEDGSEQAGFGQPTRTSIFDYVGVPAHQRWMNGGAFDGGLLTDAEQQLREYYQRVLNIAAHHPAMTGQFASLHSANRWSASDYGEKLFAFTRWDQEERLLVLANLDDQQTYTFDLIIPQPVLENMALREGEYDLRDLLDGHENILKVNGSAGKIAISVAPLTSIIYRITP